MAYPTISAYSLALSVPKGRRPLHPSLDEINQADIAGRIARYTHWACGSFAVVFRCSLKGGGQKAFRCFLAAPSPTAADRFNAYSRWYQQSGPLCDYFVEARLVQDAIQIDGASYSAYVMDWIEGHDLLEVVGDFAGQRDKKSLAKLATTWETLCQQMVIGGVAHGDIQHGNVMVTPQLKLKLVDYDTIIVPGFQETYSEIAGCPGYTHPAYLVQGPNAIARRADLHMDDLAQMVILLSLRVLAEDPSLFGKFTDENLLLSESDLAQPDRSVAFQHIQSMGNPSVTRLCDDLIAACKAPIGSGPQVSVADHRSKPRERESFPTAVVQPRPVYVPGSSGFERIQPQPKKKYLPGDSK